MKQTVEDIKRIISHGLNPLSLGKSKGSTAVFYKGKLFYMWADKEHIFLQGKWFWNKKHIFPLADAL